MSSVVYEHRSPTLRRRRGSPRTSVRRRWRRLEAISEDLGPPSAPSVWASTVRPTRRSSPIAYAWVAGEGFAEVVADEELTGGDFVRTIKQLIDLLRQFAIVAPNPATRRAAARAAEAAFRGVVADSAAPSPKSA